MNGTAMPAAGRPYDHTVEQQWPGASGAGRAPAPAPAPGKKVRRWPWALGGVVFGIVIGASAAGGGSAARPTAAVTAAAPVAPTTVASAPVSVPVVAAPVPTVQSTPAPVAPAAPAGPLTTFGNGTYEVGVDVAPGKYRSAGVQDSMAPMCYFDQTDAEGTIKDQGVANEGPSRATLKAGLTFKSSGCQQWTKVG